MPDNDNGPSGSGVCLCILFNHPFVANIPLLRRIYAGRFSTIRFLVPFERVEDPDVLTVYRGSFAHCAYAAEHLPLLAALDCSHYIFTHDDVLLSPYVNESNIRQVLDLDDDGTGWIGAIFQPPEDIGAWGFQLGSAWRLLDPRNLLSGTGVDSFAALLRHIPSPQGAATQAGGYGVAPVMTLRYDPSNFPFGDRDRRIAGSIFGEEGEQTIEVPYPIACSGPYTDFYVVPRRGLAQFAHIAAVLATAGLFVEMAAPTALYLACDRLHTQATVPVEHRWELASVQPRDALARLLQQRSLVSLHPVKLSTVRDPDGFVAQLDVTHAVSAAIAAGDYRAAVEAEYPEFDAGAYIDANPDLAATNAPPHEHFYRYGLEEGRRLRLAAASG